MSESLSGPDWGLLPVEVWILHQKSFCDDYLPWINETEDRKIPWGLEYKLGMGPLFFR